MPSDINKIISANPIKPGGAVACIPSCEISAISSLASVHYGAAQDIDAQAALWAKKWKIRAYYYESSYPYSPNTPSDTVIGTTGQDAGILYTADAYGSHVIDGLSFSYSGTVPTTGNIAVQVPSGTNIFSADVAGTGLQSINFPNSLRGSGNNSMYVVLRAGSVGDVGKLTVFGHRVE